MGIIKGGRLMKKVAIKTLVIFLILNLFFQWTCSTMATNLDEMNSQKKENEEKINNVNEKKEEITEEKNKTVAEVTKIEAQITDYENQINELDEKISKLNSQIEQAEEKIKEEEENYAKQQGLLQARLVAIQEAGETSYLDFLLSSESITDLISNI